MPSFSIAVSYSANYRKEMNEELRNVDIPKGTTKKYMSFEECAARVRDKRNITHYQYFDFAL